MFVEMRERKKTFFQQIASLVFDLNMSSRNVI